VLLVRKYQYFTNDIAYDIALVPAQKSLSYIIAADNIFYISYYIVTIMASSRAASPYRCEECKLAFSSRQDLEEHNLTGDN
jgi:hypothetical protein